ncbi:MAG TPA: gluconate 2-dehydrogenase subunit 3 family protein [Vicinamibacterales bacterium]
MAEFKLISRRDLLRNAGVIGAAAVAVPAATLSPAGAPGVLDAAAPGQAAAPPREAFENLTATEADLLEAVVERLIPTDANGPGAKEARAAHFIDRALGGALAASRPVYASGLEALDRYAQSSRRKGFLQLSPADQDAVLSDCEKGTATGFNGGSTNFFSTLLAHTRQGMFGDPYYGGNANFVGWDLIGYPGVRTMVTAADQRALESGQLKPNHRSAYDYETFNKAVAKVHGVHGVHEGHEVQQVHGVHGVQQVHGVHEVQQVHGVQQVHEVHEVQQVHEVHRVHEGPGSRGSTGS